MQYAHIVLLAKLASQSGLGASSARALPQRHLTLYMLCTLRLLLLPCCTGSRLSRHRQDSGLGAFGRSPVVYIAPCCSCNHAWCMPVAGNRSASCCCLLACCSKQHDTHIVSLQALADEWGDAARMYVFVAGLRAVHVRYIILIFPAKAVGRYVCWCLAAVKLYSVACAVCRMTCDTVKCCFQSRYCCACQLLLLHAGVASARNMPATGLEAGTRANNQVDSNLLVSGGELGIGAPRC
jgi:hypothetical protein